MRIFLILFFYLNLIFCFCENKNKKVICDSPQEIYLNENEIVFFESPDFPNSMTLEMMQNCTLNIFGNNATNEESKFLTIVLTDGYLNNFVIIDGGNEPTYFNVNEGGPSRYQTTNSSIVFTYGGTPLDAVFNTAFQGYIIYEKFYGKNSCDMVKIAQPLFLDDETEIIYIYANYYNIINVKCSWTFTAPKDYGFKFTSIIRNVVDISNATVIVKNSSDYIITDIYTKSNLPYYNVDHNITVILEANSSYPVFNAFITIVKKDFERTFGNCKIDENDGYFTWSNNYYPNNAYCNLTTPITSSQQLFVAPISGVVIFENLADPVTIEIDGDENNIIIFTHNGQGDDIGFSLPFGPYEKGTTKTIFWNFESDGSISTQGFYINFIFYECECNNLTITVPCEKKYVYTLIDSKNISNNDYKYFYCANMNCTFTIDVDKNCPDKYILTEMEINYGTFGNSSFKLISNNYTFVDLSITNRAFAIIKPKTNTKLEFISGEILENGKFYMDLQAYDKYKVLPTITITQNIPWQVLDSYLLNNKRMLLPIELSEELKLNNDSLQIDYSSADLIDLQFYSDLNLTQLLSQNKINSMNLKTFVIFINTNFNRVTVKAKKASTENCRFTETIFYIKNPDFDDNLILRNSILSNEQGGVCQILIVNYLPIMVIKNLFTYQNESKKQIEIFEGLNEQTKLIEINQTDAYLWQSLVLTTKYYVIKIPPHSSLFFESYDLITVDGYPGKNIDISFPCFSILETNEYGSLSSFDPSSQNVPPPTYIIQNITLQFTVRDYDISKNGTLGFQDALGNKKMLTGVNQTVEFLSTTVMLIYTEPEDGYKGARINLKAFHKKYQ